MGVPVDDIAERWRVEPAAARIASIFQHGKAQLDFGIGQGLRLCARARSCRELERRSVQSPVVRAADFLDDLQSIRGEAIPRGPDGLAFLRIVIGGQSRRILAAFAFASIRKTGKNLGGDRVWLGDRGLCNIGSLIVRSARRRWRRGVLLGRR